MVLPVFRIEDEHGRWLTDMTLSAWVWEAGDSIYRGGDKLDVLEVRPGGDKLTIVVKGLAPKSE